MEEKQQTITGKIVELNYLLNGMYYVAFRNDPKYSAHTVAYVGQIISRIEGTEYYLISMYADGDLTNLLHCSIVPLERLKDFQFYQNLEQFEKARQVLFF
jgi:hypothetical protein